MNENVFFYFYSNGSGITIISETNPLTYPKIKGNPENRAEKKPETHDLCSDFCSDASGEFLNIFFYFGSQFINLDFPSFLSMEWRRYFIILLNFFFFYTSWRAVEREQKKKYPKAGKTIKTHNTTTSQRNWMRNKDALTKMNGKKNPK